MMIDNGIRDIPLQTEGRKKNGQYLAAGVLLALSALLTWSLADNSNMQWSVAGSYLFNADILTGLVNTIVLTVVCMMGGTVLGTLIAIIRLSSNPVLRTVAWVYIWIFRGTPLLVQLIFWYNLALIFPVLGIGIPFTDISTSTPTNAIVTALVAAVLGFTLNEAAYMAEIMRSGISSVDPGQREAALSSGMTESKAMRRIVLPQAMRVIVPPTANQAISMLKNTSLVAFISGGDILSRVQNIYAVNFKVIPLLLAALFWYLMVTTVASIGQYYLEKSVGKGFTSFSPDQVDVLPVDVQNAPVKSIDWK
ncbi:amino acid ABC transporter permease [Nocardia miyunensis]|uniref:amino acid ABC transporter permease n=1 Tax=Nocardia miyunensis TaxID=282684 RepID=UPI000B1B970B|nr:amino acid ABC transporter permease [Nocardia miyunensis]